MGYLLGIDLGTSSVKAALLDAQSGACVASAFCPATEQRIHSPQPGFAEQDPDEWYANTRDATRAAMQRAGAAPRDVNAIGIAYQMHGLVCIDKALQVLRPAIIWCDSRAVEHGQRAFEGLGADYCLNHLLNSPGNFTAAKLAWVKQHEPDVYARIDKIMLPGDWLALRLTGRSCTTASGLSEGVFWDFKAEQVNGALLEWFEFSPDLLPAMVPSLGRQGELTAEAAAELGLAAGTPVTYRAGDQPNNALSLNVLEPGEIAATAGTSGVVYGITAQKKADRLSRVNTFLHVNHSPAQPRLGVLLCISGTGILNAWARRMFGSLSYTEMNDLAASAPVGAHGLTILPFGNGAERMLGNRTRGAQIGNLDLNRHGRAELCRALQEGIAFAFRYGMEIMRETGIEIETIRAGDTNMFQSSLFGGTLAGVSGSTIELYETDGARGAARGAGMGCGLYGSFAEAFASLQRRRVIEPGDRTAYEEAYTRWCAALDRYNADGDATSE